MPSPHTRTLRAGNPAHWVNARALSTVNETSAGDLVVDVQNGQAFTAVIAWHNRDGHPKRCLPEGHLGSARAPGQVAVREIMGEAGITDRVLRHLATIGYWFVGHGHRVYKVAYHFLLEVVNGTLATENDSDYEAKDVEWVTPDDVSHRLAHPNERRIVVAAWDTLAGDG